MKASYLGAMGYAHRRDFLPTWPTPPSYSDPETSVQSYQDGMEECEFAEEMGFEWVSFSEHHFSGRIATGTPAVMAAAVAERCKTIKIAMLGPLMPLNNPVRAAEELTLLDNLTNGRLVMGFLRGTPNEDQVYGVNPAEGRGRMLEGMDLILKAMTEPQALSWEGTVLPVPHGVSVASGPSSNPSRPRWSPPAATTPSATPPSITWAWASPSYPWMTGAASPTSTTPSATKTAGSPSPTRWCFAVASTSPKPTRWPRSGSTARPTAAAPPAWPCARRCPR